MTKQDNRDLPADIPVSIVVATYDRPDDLRCCLRSLIAQNSPRKVEIIVVDNHPASGLTPPVVSEFAGVILVREPRRGLAYGRNAGFIASSGDIAVTTDDDVIMSPDWLEKLLRPFMDEKVMVATGNILPLELETEAQRLFEKYGGLGRGFERKVIGLSWFRSFHFQAAAPTWSLGATANAAFRTSIFKHPKIGLMKEVLGPGMPSGVGEDTYLFYKILKAGYVLVYEPEAIVWHKHRRTMSELKQQIYNYSKGHVAYHLITFFCDFDLRALVYVFILRPPWLVWRILVQIANHLLRKDRYSLTMILIEIAGNLAGPWALWKSYRLVKQLGTSASYRTVSRHFV